MRKMFGVIGILAVYTICGSFFDGQPLSWYHGMMFSGLGALMAIITID
mgnify:CR=1 FL=1